jgi:hypothetical protein
MGQKETILIAVYGSKLRPHSGGKRAFEHAATRLPEG